MKRNQFIILLLLLTINAMSQVGDLEKSLLRTFDELQVNWTEKMINDYKMFPEENVSSAIVDITKVLASKTGRITGTSDENYIVLQKDFFKNGIFQYNDIRYLTALFFHRKLNSKPLDIENELKFIVAFQKKKQIVRDIKIKTAIANYHKFNVGDTITLIKQVYDYEPPINYYLEPEWIYDKNRDSQVKAIIRKKGHMNKNKNPESLYFEIYIVGMNHSAYFKLHDIANIFLTEEVIQ